jgi:hypothetical protein
MAGRIDIAGHVDLIEERARAGVDVFLKITTNSIENISMKTIVS